MEKSSHQPLSVSNFHFDYDEYKKMCDVLGVEPAYKKDKKVVKAADKAGEFDPADHMFGLSKKFDAMYPIPDFIKKYQPMIDYIQKSYSPGAVADNYGKLLTEFKNASTKREKRGLMLKYALSASEYEHPLEWAKHGMFYNLFRPIGRLVKYGFENNTNFATHLSNEKSLYGEMEEKKKKKEGKKKIPFYIWTPSGLSPAGYFGDTLNPTLNPIAPTPPATPA